MRRLLITIVLLAATAFAQTTVPPKPKEPLPPGTVPTPQCADHHTFRSAALEREMAYCVLLPGDYASSKDSYPVLYLLHGLFGSENDWLAKTRVADYARPLRLIIVMPEGDDGWYTNSVVEPMNRYEDYVSTDLVREIESKYRVEATREHRFVAGLSMGGYGALKMAFKHSDEFSLVGAFSAARLAGNDGQPAWMTQKLAFGNPAQSLEAGNNLYGLAAKSDPAKLPYFILTCGTADPLRPGDRQMAELMNTLGIRYEYSEFPGAHDWHVWNRSALIVLTYLRATGAVETLAPAK